MKRISLFLFTAFFVTVILFPLGCSGGGNNPKGITKIKIGFVTNNDALFWNYAESGCNAAVKDINAKAKDYVVEVLFRRPPTNTAATQKEIIDALLIQGLDGIAVSVIDPKNQTPYINSIAAKIPLITQDNDAPKSNRLCYIGTDNYEAGKAAGKLVSEVMPEGGVIAIFVGHNEPLNARQRRQGVLDQLAGSKDAKGEWYGKYHLYGSGGVFGGAAFTDEVNDAVAKDNADKVLIKFSDEKKLCMVGLWGYNPPQILAAVEAKNRAGEVKIVGFDEYPITLIGIQEGKIYGTVVQQPFKFGYESVELLVKVVRGDNPRLPPNGIRHVPHRVITKDNVAGFREELKKLQ